MTDCPACGIPVVTAAPNERTAVMAAHDVSDVEVIKCTVSDHWHVVPPGGTGQPSMFEGAA